MRYWYEGDIDVLHEWVTTAYGFRDPEPDPAFVAWVQQKFPLGSHVRFYPSLMIPEPHSAGQEWYRGYPHKHSETMGWPKEVLALMVYLKVPQEGGQICIGGHNPDDEYDVYDPAPGMALMVDGDTWHGVTPVTKGMRTAIICTNGEVP